MNNAVAGYPGVQLSLPVPISELEFADDVMIRSQYPIESLCTEIWIWRQHEGNKTSSTFQIPGIQRNIIRGIIIQIPKIDSVSEWAGDGLIYYKDQKRAQSLSAVSMNTVGRSEMKLSTKIRFFLIAVPLVLPWECEIWPSRDRRHQVSNIRKLVIVVKYWNKLGGTNP